MIWNRLSGLKGLSLLFVGALLVLGACADDSDVMTSPTNPEAAAAKVSRQAHLWLSFANADQVYFGADENAWLTDSWVTEAGTCDLVVDNRAKFATYDVVLMVTVPSKVIALPGWMIVVNGVPLDPGSFTETDPGLYGNDAGSHGVYPPSGNGVFCPVPIAAELPKKTAISVPIIISAGGVPGFMVHFDVGSSALYNPNSHDATVLAPDVPPPALEACCFIDGYCEELTVADCEAAGGVPQGELTVCDPNPCPIPPALEACCFLDGHCEELIAADCETAGGVPQGEMTVCDPNPCPPPPPVEACCFTDGHCEALTVIDCETAGGIAQGEMSVCDPNPCGQPELPGACCFVNGDCLELLPSECDAQGGVSLGGGSVCVPGGCGE